MAYDAYGRPQRGNGEPGYFESSLNHAAPDYTNYYSNEPRERSPGYRRRDDSIPRRRFSPPPTDNFSSTSDRAEPLTAEGVSPELIAAITERVKKELVEHLKQTGNIDEQPRAPPMQKSSSNKSSSTSSPPPTARTVYTPPSPTYSTTKQSSTGASTMEPARSPPTSPLDKPGSVRFSNRGAPNHRPTMSRKFSQLELSTIDQKWGRLFENEGTPTKRLGEFLRGLANHIIDAYTPKKSIVVTPVKMAEFYARYPLPNEPHPLLTIFRAQTNEQISHLYQDLGCQHHLVQEDSHSAPVVPALTPVGFAHWMTINILAYPEEETKRLGQVVLIEPIDADGDLVDGKPERLPKQISRHLLPEAEDHKTRKLLDKAILNFLDDIGKPNTRKQSIASSPTSRRSSSSHARPPHPVEIHQTKTSPPSSKAPAQPIERERNPYSGAPPASDYSSGEDPIKIERERAPYTAQPGSGKVHSDGSNLDTPTRPGRSNSSAHRAAPKVTAEQVEINDSRHHRTQSNASSNYRPRPGRRTSSPPIKGFSNSTPDDIQHTTSKYGPNPSSSATSFATFSPGSYGSNPSFPPPPGPPPMDSQRRPRDDRPYRRVVEEDYGGGGFTSPRDAEKWDRYEESRTSDPERYDRGYERSSVASDPRDGRGAPAEDWYRESTRGGTSAYDAYGRRYP